MQTNHHAFENLDFSTLPLNLTNHKWEEFLQTKSGVKLHLRLIFMEKGLSYPDQAVLTNAVKHGREQLEVLIDDKACMYVFYRGYLDYDMNFSGMTDDEYFFVSRLRKNVVVRVLDVFPLADSNYLIRKETS